jgi:hypothetical protein
MWSKFVVEAHTHDLVENVRTHEASFHRRGRDSVDLIGIVDPEPR